MKRLAAIFALAIALAVRGTFAATDLGELALASDVTTAVRYVSQPLSDAQKSQARRNIGAVITAPDGYTDWTVTPSHSDMFGDISIEWFQYGETDWCWAWVGSNCGTIDLTYNENQNATSLSTDFDRTYTATRSPKPGYLFAGDTSHVMAKQSDMDALIATNRLLEARIAALESVVTNLEATLHFINTGNQP